MTKFYKTASPFFFAFIFLVSFFIANLVMAQNIPYTTAPVPNKNAIDLQAVTVGQLTSLYFKEISKKDYVLCDAVINDTKLISIRSDTKALDTAFYHKLLDLYGYQAKHQSGIFYICTKEESPLDFGDAFLYKPNYRDVSYLVGLVAPLVKGTFANRRGANTSSSLTLPNSPVPNDVQNATPSQTKNAPPPTSSSLNQGFNSPTQQNHNDDYIIFLGAQKEKDKLAKILAQLDTPTGEVVLKGYVYEVGKTESEISGLDMFVNIFKNVMPTVIAGNVGGAYIFKNISLQYVSQVLSNYGNFKIVTSPYTRVKSGSTARFTVGSDVPILGSIVTTGTGTSTQSVEYKSSGSLFEVKPIVHTQSIEVDLFQQISSFVKTTTGVNNSPTLNKRELRTSLTIAENELLIIGGLNDSNKNSVTSYLWPFTPVTGTSSQYAETEIILILEVKKI